LGRYAVGGVINPDHYLVAYQPPGQILAQTIPPKEVMLVCRPQGGEEEVPVRRRWSAPPAWTRGSLPNWWPGPPPWRPIFAKPQDVEWALDETGPSGCSRAGRCSSRPQGLRTRRPGP